MRILFSVVLFLSAAAFAQTKPLTPEEAKAMIPNTSNNFNVVAFYDPSREAYIEKDVAGYLPGDQIVVHGSGSRNYEKINETIEVGRNDLRHEIAGISIGFYDPIIIES